MFSSKSLFAAVASATFIGSVAAFTGTATIGFTGTTNCGCGADNGPSVVSIPAALVGAHVCCNEEITITYNGTSVAAVFNGVFNAGVGTDNIQVSAFTFDALGGNSGVTSLSPVTWAFNV